eukprot:594979-Amphidinium_carterae.1
MGQQIMLMINQQTTFDEVHQWISNYFNSMYTGTEDDKAPIGNINEETEKQEDQWYDEHYAYNGYEEYMEEYNEEDL